MKFSIITISYNQGNYLEECIKSVLNQKYKNIEHIVIDNISTDETYEILKKYKLKDKRFKYIRQKDKGPADALNKGFSIANGDIFYFLNSDDYLIKNSLNLVHQYFKKKKKIDILLAAGFKKIENTKKKIYVCSSKPNLNSYLLGISTFFQQGMFFTRKIYKQFGPFNIKNKISWDGELYVNFLFNKVRIVRVFDPVAIFRIQNLAITSQKNYLIKYKNYKKKMISKYLKKNFFIFKDSNKILFFIKLLFDPKYFIFKFLYFINFFKK
jgi:glycosyltransferase involved in cell wall biosynthesis